MTIRFTYGISANDKRSDGTWESPETFSVPTFADFISLLEADKDIVREPWQKDGVCLLPEGMEPCQPSTPWFGAFLLDGRSRRRKEDVIAMGRLFTADMDDGNKSLTEMRAALPGTPCCFFTTTKSRKSARRWRIVAECDREHTTEEFDSLFRAMSDRFGGLDKPTRNFNRIQFVPCRWTSSDENVFARYDTGTPLCVDEIVAAYPPIPEPTIDCFDLTEPPPAAEVITAEMILEEMGQPAGSGRMWRLLCAAARRFKFYGWRLTANQLAIAASAANQLISPNDPRHGLVREAQRAIDWAAAHVETTPRIDLNYFFKNIGVYYAKQLNKR